MLIFFGVLEQEQDVVGVVGRNQRKTRCARAKREIQYSMLGGVFVCNKVSSRV